MSATDDPVRRAAVVMWASLLPDRPASLDDVNRALSVTLRCRPLLADLTALAEIRSLPERERGTAM